MIRVPMAASLRACTAAWLVGTVSACAASAPKSTTAPAAAVASAPATALPAAAGGVLPVASGSPTAPTPAAETAPDSSSTATTSSTEPPAASASLAPLPVPEAPPASPPAALRVLFADELPYRPAHLRAHDSKADHRHPRDARDSADARDTGKRPYHPAPGIVVDVLTAEGGSAAELQRTARNLGYWPFRQCYEEGLRSDPRLAGKVSLELAINPSGGVDRAGVTTATLREEIVAACVAREALHLALPASGQPTTAKIDVSLHVGDEPVPAGRPVPGAEPLREALRGSGNAVRRCYANELARHPGIGGRMELRFRVRRGEIAEVDEASAAEGGGRFADVDVTRCVLGVYRGARLPAAAHGAREHAFVYALHFESAPVDVAAP